MIDQRTALLLRDMRDYAAKAVGFLGYASLEDVEANEILLFALNRAVEIVGEAASKVDPTQRATLPQIPWRSASDMSNVLIHGYDHVDVGRVVRTIQNDFPPLIAEIERLLNESTS